MATTHRPLAGAKLSRRPRMTGGRTMRSTCLNRTVGGHMARVRQFIRGDQNVRLHPTEVDCRYQTLRGPGGTTVLHLTTFGSTDRESAPKSSQSFQLDERAAADL